MKVGWGKGHLAYVAIGFSRHSLHPLPPAIGVPSFILPHKAAVEVVYARLPYLSQSPGTPACVILQVHRMTIHGFDLALVIVYFIGVTLVGLYWAKRNKSTDEYFLGNRSFGGWVIGLSMIGTSISAVTFLAFPGDTYKTAWLRIISNVGIIAGTIAAAYLYIPFFRGAKATTAYQFIEGRWGHSVRGYAAASFLPGQLLRLATILYLLSQLVHTLTGIPLWVAVIAAGIFVSFYTVVGGIEAVIWTDVVQTLILLLGGVMILTVIVLALPGGLWQIFEVALADNKLSISEWIFGNGGFVPMKSAALVASGSGLANLKEATLVIGADSLNQMSRAGWWLQHSAADQIKAASLVIGTDPLGAIKTASFIVGPDSIGHLSPKLLQVGPDTISGLVPAAFAFAGDSLCQVSTAGWQFATTPLKSVAFALGADTVKAASSMLLIGADIAGQVKSASVLVGADALSKVDLAGLKYSVSQMKTASLIVGPDVFGHGQSASWAFKVSEKTALMMLLTGILGWIDQLAANQNVVQRYCAAKTTAEARKATWVTCWMSVPIWGYFAFIGTALYVFFTVFPDGTAYDILMGLHNAKAEQILPYFALHYLPTGIAGLVVAAALAAAMSSLDSSINAISTVTIVDIYKPYMVKGRDDRHYLIVAKWLAVIASAIMIGVALILVWTPTKTLQDTMIIIGNFLGGGIMVIFMMGLFTKIGDAKGLFIGLGALYAYKIWVFLCNIDVLPASMRPPVDNYFIGITGELICAIIVIAVWYMTKHKDRDLTGMTLRTAPWVWKKKEDLDTEELAEIEQAHQEALAAAKADAEARKL
jgi:Na+/proline symporter